MELRSLKLNHGLMQCLPADEFKTYLRQHNIKVRNSTEIWPQGNAPVEIINKSLNKAIVAAHTEGKNWREAIWDFILAHNSTPHTTTKLAPATIRFGRDIRSFIPDISTLICKELLNRDTQASERDQIRKAKNKANADKH